MAPNTVSKPAFIDYERRGRGSEHRSIIRTDFVLQNVFSHVTRTNFQTIGAPNGKEEKELLSDVIIIVDLFRRQCGQHLRDICLEMPINMETIVSTLQGIVNELFCNGISWSRIVTLFAFIGEFTLVCLSKGMDNIVIDVIYEYFCRVVKENLVVWIEDHDGWEGLRQFKREKMQYGFSSPNNGWAKSILHGTILVFGTFARLANFALANR